MPTNSISIVSIQWTLTSFAEQTVHTNSNSVSIVSIDPSLQKMSLATSFFNQSIALTGLVFLKIPFPSDFTPITYGPFKLLQCTTDIITVFYIYFWGDGYSWMVNCCTAWRHGAFIITSISWKNNTWHV